MSKLRFWGILRNFKTVFQKLFFGYFDKKNHQNIKKKSFFLQMYAIECSEKQTINLFRGKMNVITTICFMVRKAM